MLEGVPCGAELARHALLSGEHLLDSGYPTVLVNEAVPLRDIVTGLAEVELPAT